MMWDRKSVGIFFLALLSSTLFVGAAPVLNPRVTRTARPVQAPVADECHESLAPAPAPRVDVREIPSVQYVALDYEAPRTTDLRTTLRDAHNALRRNDRGDFEATLTRTRALLATYPPGAERRGAEELLRIYEDAALVWDAQFESPFFDAGAPIHARLSAYPGWADAVRRNTLTDDRDRRFFPAAESRVFLAGVAADRLSRLGIRATAPATPRTSVPRVASDERRAPRVTPSDPATTGSSTSTTRTRRSSSPAAKSPSSPARSSASTAESTRRETPARRTPDVARSSTGSASSVPASPRQTATSGSSKPASSSTASGATSTPPAAVAIPSPSASGSAAAAETPSTSSAETTVVTTSSSTGDTSPTDTAIVSDPLAADTAATSSGEVADTIAPTTSSADPIPATPTRTRSILLPTILILIGLGVLIVLFRVSN